MLTKEDLKNIGEIIDQKLEEKLESKLEEKLESKLEEKLESKLKPIKEDIANIRKDQKALINFFDREYFDLRKRDEKIEKVLKLN